jgi:hypothetical protein
MPADLHRVAEILNESVDSYAHSPQVATARHINGTLSPMEENAIRAQIETKGFCIITDETGRSFKFVRNESGMNTGEPTPVS